MLFELILTQGLNDYISPTLYIDFQCQWHVGIAHAITWHSITNDDRKGFLIDHTHLTRLNDLGAAFMMENNVKEENNLGIEEMPMSAVSSQDDIEASEDWDSELNDQIVHFKLDVSGLPKYKPQDEEIEGVNSQENIEISFGNENDMVNETSTDGEMHGNHFIYNTKKERPYEMVQKNPKKVYVTNVSYKVSQKSLWSFFQKFGRVRFCQLLLNHRRSSKGRAFVTFADTSAAEAAVSAAVEERTLDDREMYIQPALQKQYISQKEEEKSKKQDESNNEDQECHQYSNIHLTDDCLHQIFSYLQLRDLVRIERVCRQWRNVSLAGWKSRQSLHFREAFTRFLTLNDPLLRNILSRGCENMKLLDVSASSRLLTDRSLEAIAKYCKNVDELDLSGMNITNIGIRKFVAILSAFKKISLQRCYNVGDDGIWFLLKYCRNLQWLDLTGNARIGGKCFHVLTPEMSTLILDDCNKLADAGVEKICQCPGLRHLSLNNCSLLSDASLSHLLKCKHFEVLHLGGFSNISDEGLKQLARMSTLNELQLKNNPAVVDNVLHAVSQGCKLIRTLDISRCCHGVSDSGIALLSNLPHLTKLDISYLYKVTDHGLQQCFFSSPVTHLVARGCGQITDEGVSFLLEHCCSLQLLDVSGCDNIMKASVEAAILHCQTNTDKKLHFVVGGTMIDEDLCTESLTLPSNLTLCLDDLSDYHFRKDRDIVHHFELSDEDDIDDFNLSQDDDAEAFLDYDDPLYEERFNMS